MTAEEKQYVAEQIKSARKRGVEEGCNQRDREGFCWVLFKIVLGFMVPVIVGCVSLGVADSFWAGFVIGIVLECIPWW